MVMGWTDQIFCPLLRVHSIIHSPGPWIGDGDGDSQRRGIRKNPACSKWNGNRDRRFGANLRRPWAWFHCGILAFDYFGPRPATAHVNF